MQFAGAAVIGTASSVNASSGLAFASGALVLIPLHSGPFYGFSAKTRPSRQRS
jgi:hypothetical protein